MARLKITTPPTDDRAVGTAGWAASVFLDGVDISRLVHRVEVDVDANEAICARLHVYVSELEVDVPAELTSTPASEDAAVIASLGRSIVRRSR